MKATKESRAFKSRVVYLAVLSGLFSLSAFAEQDVRDSFQQLAGKTRCLSEEDAVKQSLESESCTAKHFFIGASLGIAFGDFDKQAIQQEAEALGFEIFDLVIDDRRSAWKVAVGMNLTENSFIQAGYTNLGEVSAAFSTTTNEPVRFFEEASQIRPTSVDGYTLSTSYQFWRHESWYLHAHIGLLFWNGDYDSLDVFENEVLVQDLDDDGTDIFYGVGANWRVSKGWTISTELERYHIEGSQVDMITLGVMYAVN
jgi:hypothetical protein